MGKYGAASVEKNRALADLTFRNLSPRAKIFCLAQTVKSLPRVRL